MSDSLDRINAAIGECLERIERAGKTGPRGEMQAYLLEKQGKLSMEELRTVESMVFRIIQDRENRRH